MVENQSIKFNDFGFPSDLVPPTTKNTPEYNRAFTKAFNGEFRAGRGRLLRYAKDEYVKNDQYASGNQPIDQYKKMLGEIKNKGKANLSWRNLDWNVLPILPTFVQMLKNKVLGQQKDILIKGIDPISQNEERVRRNQILTYLTNLPILQQAQQDLGVPIDSPIEEGAPVPANTQEVEMHMQMFPKDRYIMELYDQIERVMDINGWKQIWDEVVEDLVKHAIGGTKCYIDATGMVRVRRINPSEVITNNCVKPDFSDMTRIAEYVQMSINELRASVPRGTFTEEEYAKMASKASGKVYNIADNASYFSTNYRYPYDNEKVMVMDAEWISTDDMAYVVAYTNSGNPTFTKQKNPQWLNDVKWTDETGRLRIGVSDDQYVEFYKKKGEDRQIIRDGVENLYGCKWVVGTEYVYDYGLKTNMQRSISRLGACRFNYNLYTFFDSYIKKAEPVADQIQLNWLQRQHHIANSKPDGLLIDKRALTTLSVGGKGGIELNETDVLRMYVETGNMVHKGVDAAGRPYMNDPIKNIVGGMSDAVERHMNFIIQDIDLLRHIFGLNEATDGSTPNPKLGKKVAEILQQNTNTALGQVYHAYSKLFEETVKSIALLVPDAEMIKTPSKDEGLGESSGQFFRANNDTTFREMGIKIEDGPTSEVREALQKYIELAVGNQEIYSEDAYLIEKEDNIMRKYHLLAMKKRQKREADMAEKQQLFDIENQKNIDSATATAEAKRDADIAVMEAEVKKAYALQPLEERKIALKVIGDVIVEKMKQGHELDVKERDHIAKFMEIAEKGKQAKELEKMKPKPVKKSA